MYLGNKRSVVLAAMVVLFALPFVPRGKAQGRIAAAKNIRCAFPLNATGTWKKDGSPEAAVNPADLILLFDSINIDEGTAQLKNGSVGSEIIGRLLSAAISMRSSPNDSRPRKRVAG